MQPAKSVVFELLPKRLHAHHAGERRIDIEGLFRIAPAALEFHVLERAHVVQTVCKLDEKHTNIARNGDKEFAEAFCLLGLLRNEIEPFDLRQTIDKGADLRPEHLIDLGTGRVGILDHIMQQRRRDGRVVELQICENCCDFERMRKIRSPRRTLLIAVRLHGIDIGAVEERLVSLGIVFENPLDEFVLPHHDPPHSFWAQA